MKILKLTAENIKRLSVVEITPTGDLVIIGGKNGAGKSSVLDAIAYALGGTALVPDRPVRQGQAKAKVMVDLGDLVVTRTFTASGGGSLSVAGKDGAKLASPQAVLDKLVGQLSFDPLAFAHMKPADQRETLRRLAGLDTADLDAARAHAFDERTQINRDEKNTAAQLAAMPHHADAPAQEIPADAVRVELQKASGLRDEAQRAQVAANEVTRTLAAERERAKDLTNQIVLLERDLASAKAQLRTATNQIVKTEQVAKEAARAADMARAAVPDSVAVSDRLTQIETTNRHVADNRRRAEVVAKLKTLTSRADALTRQIEQCDGNRQRRIAAAQFPVPGLALTDTGVTLAGVPFEQASSGEQLRVSVAMGLALNPTLKVLLVREGSLLDADGVKLIAEMAEQADAQVWLERVAESKAGVSVLIEDGSVV